MPKVIGYTPPWLSRPSPGAKIFSDPAPQSPSSPSKRSSYLTTPPSSTDYQGPRRLVATRGTEIFTVVGNKIRWADLVSVRDEWEDGFQSGNSRSGLSRATDSDAQNHAYRTLDVSVYYKIRQMVISPSGSFLAICTEHTVHIAVLPPSSRLSENESSPLKLKTYQLGPTIHVIPESPLASVLWHPLASSSNSTDCIVTITAEAAVRVWEIDRSNKWSFERPALAIDLRKLADGVSSDQDFEPSGFGKTRGFSVDDFDMEVSSACFGGRGRSDEDPWAAMTLWVAMRNSDIYALCPLLPSKWAPTPTTIPALSTAAVSRIASVSTESNDQVERKAADQQYEWASELDREETQLVESADSLGQHEVCLRPQNPSAIPRLQGPFSVQPSDDDTDIEISDIFVFPAILDEQEILSGEDDDDDLFNTSGTVPFTTVCVATPDNELWFAIDLDGVSGQWLPKKGRSAFGLPSADAKELTLIDTFALDDSLAGNTANWPTFTVDVVHNYSVFLTSTNRVYSLSLNDWITRLAAELTGSEGEDHGLKTRLETSVASPVCITNKLLETSEQSAEVLSAPAIIDDTGLGYFLLTSTVNTPYAVSFDQAHLRASTIEPSSPELSSLSPSRILGRIPDQPVIDDVAALPSRSPYTPASIFYVNHLQPLDNLRGRLPPNLKKVLVERPLRLSPFTLEIMTAAHRTVSVQTSKLENAASELFRRCERLREELGDQVKQMTDLAQRLQRLQPGGEEDENGEVKVAKSHQDRIVEAKDKQAKLVARYEAVRRTVGRLGGRKRELSSKETAWINEIDVLASAVGIGSDGAEGKPDDDRSRLDARYDTVGQDVLTLSTRINTNIILQVKKLSSSLLEESQMVEKQSPALEQSVSSLSASTSLSRSRASIGTAVSNGGSGSGSTLFGVSSRLQKERIADVMAMVEREGAVIDAVVQRLDKLKVEY